MNLFGGYLTRKEVDKRRRKVSLPILSDATVRGNVTCSDLAQCVENRIYTSLGLLASHTFIIGCFICTCLRKPAASRAAATCRQEMKKMHKRIIAIALCLVMVSAFAVTGAVSAAPQTFTGWAGESQVGKFSGEIGNVPFFGIQNHKDGHTVIHDYDKDNHFVSNFNTNNPNGAAPPE